MLLPPILFSYTATPANLKFPAVPISTMRLILSQGIEPVNFAAGAKVAAAEWAAGEDVKAKLATLWPQPWTEEHDKLISLMDL